MNTAGTWTTKNSKLYKRFEFEDFARALDFINKVGELAEKETHHPDISFGWGYAEISLFTHSENAITNKDRELADAINQIQG